MDLNTIILGAKAMVGEVVVRKCLVMWVKSPESKINL